MTLTASRWPFHYAWLVLLAAILTLFCALGLGRFALGMLLPSMGQALSLSYSQMGAISTANFVGYLLAVLVCGRLSHVLTPRWLISVGLLLVGGSMVLVSLCQSFMPILLLYLVTGIGSGMANLSVIGLLSSWFAKQLSGKAAGSMVIGNGLGIAFSGLLIPWLNSRWPLDGWSIGWLSLGLLVAVVALFCALVLRNRPSQLGLLPLGQTQSLADEQAQVEQRSADPSQLLRQLGTIYGLFGFSYVIYLTFIVTSLVEEQGFSEAMAGNFWILLGLVSLISGPLFGILADRIGGAQAMMLVFAIQVSAYLLAALANSPVLLFCSMALYGLAAFSIPAIIKSTIRDRLPTAEAMKLFGYVTFIFGLGQVCGPALAGWLADLTGTFSSGYLLAAFATGVALIQAWRLRSESA